ncbi:tRNA (adenosine(37)-N6)-threonylcarbamoyltransferase complex dimerization subunit type 1 TsaB [uncultured Roseobacter sp.]|uniref:tRNA (adenosine(37)-N6)-threonylcarbamoyltransferase complex dimerization subunit type 1 TsaB n=1 Tax=uncultured Roseobacter sp. TaxID=114847 RepID=UPI00261EB8FF|nr:tRNA (adenosine(37)-N6)-threonylcarbamoyltransferase complex dimerization subunit type 1 TsaB [uncultured Roseobacter sp.]
MSRLPDTPILAFDTATAHCAVAVYADGRTLAQAQEVMTKGQAERLMGLCTELMSQAGLPFEALAAIGVGVGPGNFTGIRISVGAARGLALGLGVPAVGISGFDALRLGQNGPCTCVLPARRGFHYVQRFDRNTTAPPDLVPEDAVAPHEGPRIGAGGVPPRYPTAEAIARLTAQRYQDPQPRPAPLYLRPADAAPARDAAPLILP